MDARPYQAVLDPSLLLLEHALETAKEHLREAYAAVQAKCKHTAVLHSDSYQLCRDGQFFPARRLCLTCRGEGEDHYWYSSRKTPNLVPTEGDPLGLFMCEFVKPVDRQDIYKERPKCTTSK